MGEGMGSVALYVRFSKKYLFIYIKKYHARFFMKITTWLVYDVSRCRHKTVRTLERGGAPQKCTKFNFRFILFERPLARWKICITSEFTTSKENPPQN